MSNKHYLLKNEAGHYAYYGPEGELTATWVDREVLPSYVSSQVQARMAEDDELVERDHKGQHFPKTVSIASKTPKAPKD